MSDGQLQTMGTLPRGALDHERRQSIKDTVVHRGGRGSADAIDSLDETRKGSEFWAAGGREREQALAVTVATTHSRRAMAAPDSANERS